MWQKWNGDSDATGGCGGAIGNAQWPCGCGWHEGHRASGQGWDCTFCSEHGLECPGTHHDFITPDVKATIKRKHDKLRQSLAAQSTKDGEAVLLKIQPVVTHSRAYAAECQRRGLPTTRPRKVRRKGAASEIDLQAHELKSALDEYCDLHMFDPLGVKTAEEVVDTLTDGLIKEELKKRNIKRPRTEEARAKLLERRLEDEGLLMLYAHALTHPGLGKVMGTTLDILDFITDILHLEMRTGEKFLTLLFEWPYKNGYRDASVRVEEAVRKFREDSGFSSFSVTKKENSTTEIKELTIDRRYLAVARSHFKDLVSILVDDQVHPAEHAAFRSAADEYCRCIEVLRTRPSKTRGHVNFKDDALNQAILFQRHADRLRSFLVTATSNERFITNYFHMIFSVRIGHVVVS